VTPGFLGLLGARVHLGRLFLPDDALEKGRIPLILGYSDWMTSAGGDRAVIGRESPGVPGTVVIGVLAPGFVPPEALFGHTAVGHWRPLDVRSDRYGHRGERRLSVIGRLAVGATIEQGRAELAAVQTTVAREYPEGNVYPDGAALGAGLNGLRSQTVGTTGRTMLLFLASSVLLLLIAAMNAANLLLVRGLDREREMAVRLANRKRAGVWAKSARRSAPKAGSSPFSPSPAPPAPPVKASDRTPWPASANWASAGTQVIERITRFAGSSAPISIPTWRAGPSGSSWGWKAFSR
jgi:hypothetical protein